jgi:hypothetical protein
MPTNKMRVEVYDHNGHRHSIESEGQITHDKALQILNIMQLLGVIPNESQTSTNSNNVLPTELSRFEKIQRIIPKIFPLIWFASKDAQLVYEQELKEPISLSTVSTYLSRMTKKGLLMRTGTGNSVKYKVAPNSLQTVIKQQNKK